MPNTVRILRSTTAGATPSSLVSGQIAINEADGKIFYRNTSGVVTQFSAGGGGAGVSDGNKGDITVDSSGSSWTINVGAVVTADLADGAITDAKVAAGISPSKIASAGAYATSLLFG